MPQDWSANEASCKAPVLMEESHDGGAHESCCELPFGRPGDDAVVGSGRKIDPVLLDGLIEPSGQVRASCWHEWTRISHGGQSRYRSDPAASGFRRPLDAIDRRDLRTGRGCPRSALSPPRSGCPAGPWLPASSTPSRPGCLRRRQSSGTYLAGRPSRASGGQQHRHLATAPHGRRTIDLPVSPGDMLHLPPTDPSAARAG